MSAISGVYLLNGDSVDEKDLKRMNDSMPHRGPDGSGLWHDGPVGLAHQMLWTTPESLHEKLPLEADGLVIASDSRIDNREELLPELGLSWVVSDSEVILKAYGRWGKNCVDRLLGDFAFAIWDKAKEEVFCARDHMGVRPLYYYYKVGEIFAFATEIKALFAWGVPLNINEVRIGDYLAAIPNDKEMTFYQEIKRLPPANTAIINTNDLRKEQYWEPDQKHEIKLMSDEEYEKAFRKIFEEAVRCRLRSTFPIGSMLSGGLDSSSIVCMARELLSKEKQLKTISIIFETVKECDERQYINAVLKRGNVESHFVQGDLIGPFHEVETMQKHEGQPFFSYNLFLHWAMYKNAHDQNVRILLDGIDGDTTVSHGFAHLTELAEKRQMISLLKEIKGLSRNFNISPSRLFIRLAIYPFLPESFIRLWRILHGTDSYRLPNAKIVDTEFAKRIGLVNRRNMFREERLKIARTAKEDHWRGLTGGIHPLILEETNMAAASFSVEPGYPFFDKRLIEFCLALPADQKIRRGWTRRIMRCALKEILPPEIYCRGGKSDLSPNFLHGLLTFHKKALDEDMAFAITNLNGYVNLYELNESYKRLISPNKHAGRDELDVWRAMNLLFWLKGTNP